MLMSDMGKCAEAVREKSFFFIFMIMQVSWGRLPSGGSASSYGIAALTILFSQRTSVFAHRPHQR